MTTNRLPIAAIVGFAGVLAGAAVLLLASQDVPEGWMRLPLAVATGGVVVLAGLALDLRSRQARRSEQASTRSLLDWLEQRRAADRETVARLARIEKALGLMLAVPRIAAAERGLQDATRLIERWDDVALDLPPWQAAAAEWTAAVAGVVPEAVPDEHPIDDAALAAARSRLPFRKNLSSADLRAALVYVTEAGRVADAAARFARCRDGLAAELARQSE